jgi:hypothetical protein
MVELDNVLLYIRSHVCGSSVQWDPVWRLYRPLGGLPYDVRQWKVLYIAINEVSVPVSMHEVPPAIRTIVVLTGVIAY